MITNANCRPPGVLLAAIFIICLGIATISGAQDTGPILGQIMRIQGSAVVQRAGAGEFQALVEGTPIFLQDLIGTDPGLDTRMWWKGARQVRADASMGPSSVLQFIGFQHERGISQFAGLVGQGIVRFIKRLPRTNPQSSFAIFTPTALIAVIPTDEAADFFVQDLDANRTQITVSFGAVMVKNVNDQIPQQQILRSCQTVVVERDREPSGVMGVTADILHELVRRTTIPGTLPDRVPSCTRMATPPPGPWYPDYLPEPGIIFPYGPGFIPFPPHWPPHWPPHPTGTMTAPPTGTMTAPPTGTRTGIFTRIPTGILTRIPTGIFTRIPTGTTTGVLTRIPTGIFTRLPTGIFSRIPTARPTGILTRFPTGIFTRLPTSGTRIATGVFTRFPTSIFTPLPSRTGIPTRIPTVFGTLIPSRVLTSIGTLTPSRVPTFRPTGVQTFPTGIATRVLGTRLFSRIPTSIHTGARTGLSTRLLSTAFHLPTSAPTHERRRRIQQQLQQLQTQQLQPQRRFQQQQQLQQLQTQQLQPQRRFQRQQLQQFQQQEQQQLQQFEPEHLQRLPRR